MDEHEIARLRALPLADVMQSLGAELDPKDPARNWRLGASRITVTDVRFYDHNGAGALHRMRNGVAGGAGAIDLVQYIKDIGFREAVRELGGLESIRVTAVATSKLPPSAPAADTRPPPAPAADRAMRAAWYLTAVRGIPESLVQEEMAAGRIFADTRGNVVFRLRDEAGVEVGYEVRGTYDKPYHSVHGQKGLFLTKADGAKVAAFVESGIEALSYRALRATGLVISTTGSAIERPLIVARALRDRGYEILTAFNADQAGDRMAARMGERLGEPVQRDRPQAKDWNDEIQALRPRQSDVSTAMIEGNSAHSAHATEATHWER